MKRLALFVCLVTASTVVSLSWLHDGELNEAIEPVVESLDHHFATNAKATSAGAKP